LANPTPAARAFVPPTVWIDEGCGAGGAKFHCVWQSWRATAAARRHRPLVLLPARRHGLSNATQHAQELPHGSPRRRYCGAADFARTVRGEYCAWSAAGP